MSVQEKFEEWWEDFGKEKCYPKDSYGITRAKELAQLAWFASRIEISRYCLPVNDEEETNSV